MDPVGIEAVDPSGSRSDDMVASVGDKRPPENDGNGGDSCVRLGKKARVDSRGHMKRIAEIVLVLSAVGSMRGGRTPTDVEKRLMEEARERLSEICEALSPNDIVPREAVKVVMEDLGLNRAKDQRLGFRPPKMSIAEKLLLTQRKMEESKEFAAHNATYSSQRLQGGYVSKADGHVTSTSSWTQLSANEVQSSVISRGLSSSNSERDSSPLAFSRTEMAHFRLDGSSNGSAYVSEARANSSSNPMIEKAATWSLQPQSASLAKVGQESKVPNCTSIKVEGTPEISNSQSSLQVARDQTYKPFVIQSPSVNLPGMHPPPRSMNYPQIPSLYTNHNDIARNVQKFLQPKLPEHPNWIPPSRDYMNKALFCQICKVTITDIEFVLVCDACENGFHLKCLQSYNQRGIPRGEWHCPKCLKSSNGKPLPPKYGRVMRNTGAPKLSLNTTGGRFSSEKKVVKCDQKVNNQKITANGTPGLLKPTQDGCTGSVHVKSLADSKIPTASEMQGTNFLVRGLKENNGAHSGTLPDNSNKTPEKVFVSPVSSEPNQKSTQHIKTFESSPCQERAIKETQSCLLATLSETSIDASSWSQAPYSSQDGDRIGPVDYAESPSKQSNLEVVSDGKTSYDIKRDDQEVTQASSARNLGIGNGVRDCTKTSSDGLHDVDWVGDILEIVDGKTFYQSCCVNGVVYKLEDHALFHSENDNLVPSKLQVLWEDKKTRTKWATVNRCYLPTDLPEVVGRPCTPENYEVYESNHDRTVKAGLIQGPCKVLPPDKFKEETQRRNLSGRKANDGLQSVFLCKWFYDELKGLFRPITG